MCLDDIKSEVLSKLNHYEIESPVISFLFDLYQLTGSSLRLNDTKIILSHPSQWPRNDQDKHHDNNPVIRLD